tara:strand:+ start:6294 stop:7082 length:789 start_codon:yes stop_codon:yes gene_type:complete
MMNAQKMQLVWQDEFDHSGKPDPKKWSYETGFIRNLEAQYYTSRKKNVRVRNGKLIITARNEYYQNPDYDPEIKDYRMNTPETNYTSGSIHTSGKFDFKYGRIDVRASLPKAAGSWPAIWMLGSNFEDVVYPEAGEIDIMEHVGKNQGEIHGSVHYANEENEIVSKTDTTFVPNASEEFHVYSVDWNRDRIEFLVDNMVYHTFEISDAGSRNNPFRKPFFILINLALGGKWAGEIDDSKFPQKFLIDYVRVYQQIENKKAGL